MLQRRCRVPLERSASAPTSAVQRSIPSVATRDENGRARGRSPTLSMLLRNRVLNRECFSFQSLVGKLMQFPGGRVMRSPHEKTRRHFNGAALFALLDSRPCCWRDRFRMSRTRPCGRTPRFRYRRIESCRSIHFKNSFHSSSSKPKPPAPAKLSSRSILMFC
jgi:hypothetical protein